MILLEVRRKKKKELRDTHHKVGDFSGKGSNIRFIINIKDWYPGGAFNPCLQNRVRKKNYHVPTTNKMILTLKMLCNIQLTK